MMKVRTVTVTLCALPRGTAQTTCGRERGLHGIWCLASRLHEADKLTKDARESLVVHVRIPSLVRLLLDNLRDRGVVHERDGWEQVVLNLQVQPACEKASHTPSPVGRRDELLKSPVIARVVHLEQVGILVGECVVRDGEHGGESDALNHHIDRGTHARRDPPVQHARHDE